MAKRYTAIINTGDLNKGDKGYIKWRNVTNQYRVILNAQKCYPKALFVSVYDKETKELISFTNFNENYQSK